MKILATIKAVAITRQYQRQDGTFGNVYGVTFESGNDTIIAETFRTAESQKKAGIVPGAIGFAVIAFDVRPWTDKQGKAHYAQDIKLERFELANQNIRTGEAATEAAQPEASAQEVAEGFAEAAIEAEANGDEPAF